MGSTAVLTDIEGTTTDIAFVHQVLFPYSRDHLPGFLRANANNAEVAAALAELRAMENAPALAVDAAITILLRWIAEDRKAKPLKTLQGLIWMEGYKRGELRGHIYPDALAALRRWHEAGTPLYIYSSGSVAAQKLLFGHTGDGDLRPLFSGYFDTAVGSKMEAESYFRIAEILGRPSRSILFLSDNAGELQAASAAGFRVIQVDRSRPLDLPPAMSGSTPVVSGFHQIDPDSPTGVGATQLPRSLATKSLM